jgi:hypothetical protein
LKISGAYRVSTFAPDYSDVIPLAQALIAANPERIVWGDGLAAFERRRSGASKPIRRRCYGLMTVAC